MSASAFVPRHTSRSALVLNHPHTSAPLLLILLLPPATSSSFSSILLPMDYFMLLLPLDLLLSLKLLQELLLQPLLLLPEKCFLSVKLQFENINTSFVDRNFG